MSKQVLFIQGGGAGTHDEWDNKLVESLARQLGPAYEIRYPRMPDEANPTYAAWKAALEQEIAALDDGAVLIGHSLGGTILINVLAEESMDRKLSGVFLIAAPFVGAGGWSGEGFKLLPEFGERLPESTPVYLYHGSADDTAPFAHIDLYAAAIPYAVVRSLEGRDHQLDDDLAEVAADIRALSKVLPFDGGCDCRVVRYRMLKQPLFVHCCHCRWCQRESGASFALNAMIEAEHVIQLGAEPQIVDTPSNSGAGQKIARCPKCRIAIWSNYASAGPVIKFVRVGTLDAPERLPPDIHIFTSSKQPWVQLSADIPSVPEYYDRESYWPAESLARRRLILPNIEAHQASLRAG